MKRTNIFFVLVLLLCAAVVHAAPAYVGSCVNVTGNGTSVACTYSATAGNTLIVITTSTASATPSVGNTADSFTLVSAAVHGNYYVSAFEADTVGGGSHAVTFTDGGVSTELWITVYEVSGLATSAFDARSTLASGTGASATTNTATPITSGDYAIAYTVNASASNVTSWSNSFTERVPTPAYQSVADKIISGTTATSTVGTLSSGGISWDAQIFLFKAGGGGATCTHTGWNLATGAFSTPTAAVGNFWLKTGANGSTDCSATQYWQAAGGFGAN